MDFIDPKEINFNNLIYDIIPLIIVLLIVALVVWLLIRHANNYEKGKVTQRSVKIEEGVFNVFRFFVAVIHPSSMPALFKEEDTKYKCKYCSFTDNKYTEYCPACNKNIRGNLREFKCNYCFNTSNFYFDYCPKCSKNDKGKYKGGVS
ncbi:MAG: hypothetical protein H0W73_18940 [Bacteroidetes bacterium]|nr:hypothetical protein [Bacteroidota bacterium]